MSCPSEIEYGEDLVFSVCTHDPATGTLTDATGVPTYRLYEKEVATPILTGNMAKLDDSSTTGFYTELVSITRKNGFDKGKFYTIYISATVAGVEGGITYSFRVKRKEQQPSRYSPDLPGFGPDPVAGDVQAIKNQTDQIEFTADGNVKSEQQYSTGSVVTDAGNGASVFKTDLIEIVNDVHKGKYLRFTSGSLVGQVKKIGTYNGTTKVITVTSAFTGTPAAADSFDLINQ